MVEADMPPTRRRYASKWLTLVLCEAVMMSSGTLYLFPVYSPTLKRTLDLTQEQLNFVGSAAHFGAFFSVFGGLFFDAFGSRARRFAGEIRSRSRPDRGKMTHLSHDVARLDRDDGHGHAEALLREELRHASLVPENPHTRVVLGLDLEATGRRGAHGARGRGDAGAHERGRGRRRLQGLRGGRRRAHAGGKLDRGDSSHLCVSSARGESVWSTGLSAN